VLVKAQALANIQTDPREAADYNATALWARDELLWRGEVLDPNQCAFCRSALDTRGHCHDAECIRILSWRR
jgi:hypothetical protein